MQELQPSFQILLHIMQIKGHQSLIKMQSSVQCIFNLIYEIVGFVLSYFHVKSQTHN